MKSLKILCILVLIALTNSLCCPAQSVPKLINYQGKLTDASANPLPNGTYGVAFRIWSTKANTEPGDQLVFGQDYNVAVANGVFNVILGAPGGTPISGALTNDISYAFTSSERYVGITVTRGTNGAAIPGATEIIPRQQVLSTPFAFSAGTANLANSASLANSIADGTVTSTKLVDGSISTAKLADGSVSIGKLADGSVSTAKLVDGSVTLAKLSPPLRPNTDQPKTSVSPYILESGAHLTWVNVFTLNTPGRLTGVSLKSQLYNGGGDSYAYFSLRITIDGTPYTVSSLTTGVPSRVNNRQDWHIVRINPVWAVADPPTLQNSYFDKAGGVGTAVDLDIWFNSSLVIELRGDLSTDGRNGFYVATSYKN